jgi:hypothetical protein
MTLPTGCPEDAAPVVIVVPPERNGPLAVVIKVAPLRVTPPVGPPSPDVIVVTPPSAVPLPWPPAIVRLKPVTFPADCVTGFIVQDVVAPSNRVLAAKSIICSAEPVNVPGVGVELN